MVFVSQGKLWLWEDGKSASQVTLATGIKQVAISGDGQLIAFTRQLDENHAEIRVIDANGSHERRLVGAEELVRLDDNKGVLGVLPTRLQWKPGTHQLIFNTYPIFNALWIYEPDKPWQVDADTGSISPAPYPGGYFVFSPDRESVAIYARDGLNLSEMDGSNLQKNVLAPYHGITLGEQYYDPKPYWAADSSSILVPLPDQEDISDRNATVTIWRVPIKDNPISLGQWKAFLPSVGFSPDQSFMAYWRTLAGPVNQRELHLTQPDIKTGARSSDLVYESGDRIDVLAWSPDSRHFIFQMGEPAGQSLYYYLGDVCQRPVKIANLTVESGWDWDSNINLASWVGADRYLLVAGGKSLELGALSQDKPQLLGMVTDYDWVVLP